MLGPEDCATKIELETVLKRAKEQSSLPVRMDPDTKTAAARERASRLEKALTALGDFEGVEVESLRAALKRGQKEAQEVPLAAQIRERESFNERAKNRIAQLDEERQAEVRSLEEEHKLNQLRALSTAQQVQQGPVAETARAASRGCQSSPTGHEKISCRTVSRRCSNGRGTANRTCRKPPWLSDPPKNGLQCTLRCAALKPQTSLQNGSVSEEAKGGAGFLETTASFANGARSARMQRLGLPVVGPRRGLRFRHCALAWMRQADACCGAQSHHLAKSVMTTTHLTVPARELCTDLTSCVFNSHRLQSDRHVVDVQGQALRWRTGGSLEEPNRARYLSSTRTMHS